MVEVVHRVPCTSVGRLYTLFCNARVANEGRVAVTLHGSTSCPLMERRLTYDKFWYNNYIYLH